MSYRSGVFPSGINPPAIRPVGVSKPRYTNWHVVMFDITNPDDDGITLDTFSDREQALALVRGRSGTIAREGYTRDEISAGQGFLMTRPGEAIFVSLAGCYEDHA